MAILVAALVAATLARPAAGDEGLRLEALREGLRVRLRLVNVGTTPRALLVGTRCGGPRPFTLVVDGFERPFVAMGWRHGCRGGDTPVMRTLAPGAAWEGLSDAFDGRHHHVEARYRAAGGPAVEVRAPPLELPTALQVELALAATPSVRAGQPIALELTLINRSREAVTLPACGETRLLVDGHEVAWPGACAGASRVVGTGGAWVQRAQLTLPAGRHLVRGRWRDTQSSDVGVVVTP